jgi:hypothetical protein
MAPQTRYKLDDYQRYATANFPVKYASIADIKLYRFETKWTMDEQNQAHKTTLLFIGRYYITKPGGLEAWAHATTSGILYFSGKPYEKCKPVPAHLQSRIYPDYPYDLMLKSESTQRSSFREYPKWIVKESVIEAVVNFAFVLLTQLGHVENIKGTDMLSDFAFACKSFHNYKAAMMATTPPALVSSRAHPEVQLRSEQILNENCRRVRNTPIPVPPRVMQSPRIETRNTDTEPIPQREYLSSSQHHLH